MGDINQRKQYDEFGEDISNTEASLRRLGIELRKNGDEFRPFSDVLDEVASKWKTYTQVQQNDLAKSIAGVRQRENFLVLMEHYNETLDLQAKELDSTGSAMERFGAYSDSVEAKVNDFTNAVQTMWTKVISADAIKSVVEFGTILIQFLDKIGLINIAIAGLATAMVVFSTKIKGVFSSIKSVISVLPNLIGYLFGTKTAFEGSAAAASAFEGVLTFGLSLAISGFITLIVNAIEKQKQFNKTMEDFDAKVEKFRKNISDFSSLKDAQSQIDDLTASIDEMKKSTDFMNKFSMMQIDQQKLDELKKQFDSLNEINDPSGALRGRLMDDMMRLQESIKAYKSEIQPVIDKQKILNDLLAAISAKDIEAQLEALKELEKSAGDETETFSAKLNRLAKTFNDSYGVAEKLSGVLDILKDKDKTTADAVAELVANYDDLTVAGVDIQSMLSDTTNLQQHLSEAIKDQAITQGFVYEQMAGMGQDYMNVTGSQWQSLYTALASMYGTDLSNFKSIAQTKAEIDAELIKTLGANWGNYFNNQTDALNLMIAMAGGSGDTALANKLKGMRDVASSISNISAKIKMPSFSGTKSSSGGGSKNQDTYLDKINNSLDTEADKLKYNIDLENKLIDPLQKQIDLEKDKINAIEDEAELQKDQAEKNHNDILAGLESQKKTYQDQYDILQAQYDQESKINDLLEARNKLIEEQNKLTNILNEKNVRMLIGGEWQYVSDPRAVRDQEKAVQDAQDSLTKLEVKQGQEADLKAIQDQIDAEQNLVDAENTRYDAEIVNIDAVKQAKIDASNSTINTLQTEIDKHNEVIDAYQNQIDNISLFKSATDGLSDSVAKEVDNWNELISALDNAKIAYDAIDMGAISTIANGGSPSSGTASSTPSTSSSSSSAKVSALVATLKSGSKGASVKLLQTALNALGYNAGEIDGSFGPQTASALKAFQKANGLTTDAILGPKTKSAFAAKGYKEGGETTSDDWAYLHKGERILTAGMTEKFNKLFDVLSSSSSWLSHLVSLPQPILAGTSSTTNSGGNITIQNLSVTTPNADTFIRDLQNLSVLGQRVRR